MAKKHRVVSCDGEMVNRRALVTKAVDTVTETEYLIAVVDPNDGIHKKATLITSTNAKGYWSAHSKRGVYGDLFETLKANLRFVAYVKANVPIPATAERSARILPFHVM